LKNQKGNVETKIRLLEADLDKIHQEYQKANELKDENLKRCESEIKELEHQNDVVDKKLYEQLKHIELKNAEIEEFNKKLTDINGLNSVLENKVTELVKQLNTMDELLKKSNLTSDEQQKSIKA